MFILAIPNFSNFFEYYTVHSNMKAKGHHIRQKPLVPNKSVFGKHQQLSFDQKTNYENKNIEEIRHFLRFYMFVYLSVVSYIGFGIFRHKKRISFKQRQK